MDLSIWRRAEMPERVPVGSERTMKTITNFHHHATAYLYTPYFGCDKVGLKFEGDDKILSWCYFSIGKTTSDNTNIMSYAECRAVLDKIVDDMNKRCGITMQCVGNKTERQARNLSV